ncbi:hypothetical protein JQC72_16245 [Polycladomyces sp. WAk]|uniref:Uncharacterized protein n=1 Tax=Polycladomyces zharkentensis TaxID=2807616 RepID=A0ABS2WNF4_9BACL|nr:hypothetical protein [Polycladomyces sp. WAk]MBN2911044.1 hypothetical protein [Polycladomyces sp. WAk]
MFRISIHTINITTVSDAGSVNIGNTVNAVQKQQVTGVTQPGPQPQRPPAPEPTVPAPPTPGAPGGASAPPGTPSGAQPFSSGNGPGAVWARSSHPPALPHPVSGYRHPVVVVSPSV